MTLINMDVTMYGKKDKNIIFAGMVEYGFCFGESYWTLKLSQDVLAHHMSFLNGILHGIYVS